MNENFEFVPNLWMVFLPSVTWGHIAFCHQPGDDDQALYHRHCYTLQNACCMLAFRGNNLYDTLYHHRWHLAVFPPKPGIGNHSTDGVGSHQYSHIGRVDSTEQWVLLLFNTRKSVRLSVLEDHTRSPSRSRSRWIYLNVRGFRRLSPGGATHAAMIRPWYGHDTAIIRP